MRVDLLLFCALVACAQENPAVSAAIDSLQHGDLATAEQTLRVETKAHPDNIPALDVLGVVLDQEKKFAEADQIYRRATTLAPHESGLLNNYGNHLVASGKTAEARAVFLKVLALNPHPVNASVQLARISLQQKSPADALHFLSALPEAARQNPDVQLLTMQADYALGRTADADVLFEKISQQADPRRLAAALAAAGQYEKAEALFSRALEANPGNFEILYDLGLAASHAGHNQRAREVLETALAQQPENVDVLYDLAAVNAALNRNEAALQLLAQAARLAPNRTDVLRLLARTAAQLGYFADSVQAWDRYLQLAPADDMAHRERAFAQSALGDNLQAGLSALRSYVAMHPRDPVGHYELGVAESATDTAEALHQLNAALVVRPDLAAARLARGLLNYRQGNFSAALPDFEFAAQHEPDNATVLDHLGQTYMALDRAPQAVPLLSKAADLAPRDSKILMHFGRALSETGQADEAKAIFTRFRELGPDRSAFAHPAGLVDFLSLAPEEQLARYRAGVERTVQQSPNNAEAQVRYLALLLDAGKTEDAAATAARIITLKPSSALLAQAGQALLDASQYPAAKDFLAQAVVIDPSSPDLQLDLAIATFRSGDAQTALALLDRIAPPGRTGDYYLARAEMLDAAGRVDQAAALSQALHENPKRPELYRRAAALLMRNHRPADALDLLDRGLRVLPNDPALLVARAAALAIVERPADSERLLQNIENRWPEFADAWAAHALVLDLQGHPEQARRMMDTAVLLAPDDTAIRALSDSIGQPNLQTAALIRFVFR
jgi:tetratricopeptide (TPR) repeat protein